MRIHDHPSLERHWLNNPIIYSMLNADCSAEQIIDALATENDRLREALLAAKRMESVTRPITITDDEEPLTHQNYRG